MGFKLKKDKVEEEVVEVKEEAPVVEDRSAFNCPTCKGEGIVGDQKCPTCLGTGKV